MADHAQNNVADPQDLARARDTWHSFTVAARRATILIVAGVILLALITLHAP